MGRLRLDAQKFAKKSWLTASVYNWGPYYLKRVKAAMNGTWKSGFYYGSIKDGFTKLAPYGPKASRRRRRRRSPRSRRRSKPASSNEFTGPLYDQSGKLRVAKGRQCSLKGGTNQLYGMNWLVKGVIGSPKG